MSENELLIDERDKWLMLEAFNAGHGYDTFGEWLSDMACAHANVETVLAREAPTRQLPPEVEAVLEAAREFEKKNRELQQSLCLYKDFRSAELAVRDTIRAYDKSRRKS